MSVVDEYKNQSRWRSWDPYLDKLPVNKNDVILDLGCSIGVLSEKLSFLGRHIIGIDNNPDLLSEARRHHSRFNIKYILHDLKNVHKLNLPLVDGMWTSFVVSYFPDLQPVLNKWLKLLKPGGWLAVVEMSGLFDHRPLSDHSINIFKNYYVKQRKENIYDFEMGTRMKEILINCGLSISHEENVYDPELNFQGPAEPEILKSWSDRFDRMDNFRNYLGPEQYDRLKSEFLDCLLNRNHTSNTFVKFIIAIK